MRSPKAWFAIGTLMAVLVLAVMPLAWTIRPPIGPTNGPPTLPAVSSFLGDHPEFGSPARAEPAKVWPPDARSQVVVMSDRRRFDLLVRGDRVRRVWQMQDDGLPTLVWAWEEDGP